jgi:hypothetical protein
MTQADISPATRDLARQPLIALALWGLPLMLGVTTNAFALPTPAVALAWAAALAWMGLGCLLNAQRCHRLHCAIAAPVLLTGAGLCVAVAGDLFYAWPHALSYVVNITLVAAVASFAPEFCWGRYLRR